jgi:response regulator RpfG family c-di-GMP phosphodiesterase
VVRAVNGQEALKKLEEEGNISLIILDIMMPEMDGYCVCNNVKNNIRTANIPVIFVTDLTSSDAKLKCIQEGGDDFITKPFIRAELIARTRSLIDKKRAQDELRYSYQRISEIITVTEEKLNVFNPFDFDYTISNKELLLNILKKRGEEDDHNPEYVLNARKQNSSLVGNIFYKEDNELIKVPDEIKIDIDADVAIIKSLKKAKESTVDSTISSKIKLIYSNWDDKSGRSLKEYQGLFDEKMKCHIGEIRNFVTYNSGDIAVIAFNYGKHVDEFDAHILKGFVIHSNFLKTVSDQAKINEEAFLYTIEALARASEANDEDTFAHILRVNEYARTLAAFIGCPPDFVKDIGTYAQMHDVGKIHVSRGILRKPGQLTAEERDEMQKHTIYGAKILGDSSRFAMAREIAISHHEKFNGAGYPHRLSGEDIPLSGRITAMADVYDALRTKRYYKPALSHEETCKIITEGDGRTEPEEFDPRILDAFKKCEEKFQEIYKKIQDDTLLV